jgi:hypothetical protein
VDEDATRPMRFTIRAAPPGVASPQPHHFVSLKIEPTHAKPIILHLPLPTSPSPATSHTPTEDV